MTKLQPRVSRRRSSSPEPSVKTPARTAGNVYTPSPARLRAAEEAIQATALAARIDALFRSGEVDPVSEIPAFLDRKRWKTG